jgi:hypothetical protein
VNELRRRLERAEIPGEHDARTGTWAVVEAAFAEREPAPRPQRRLLPAVALAAVAIVVAAAVTPPGRAVIGEMREAIGVERAQPALFSLPAQGRLLAVSSGGAWIVHADGSKRRLGAYRDATWSPQGKFVGAIARNELVAVDPRGNVRWKLARRWVGTPRWAPSGFRIAYLTGADVKVVAGDGTGDRWLAKDVTAAPTWRPGRTHVLALAHADGIVRIRNTDTGAVVGRSRPGERARQLAWAPDGRLLLAVAPRSLRLLDVPARRWRRIGLPRGRTAVTAAFAPAGHRFALVRRAGARSEVVLDNGRRVFEGTGTFTDVAWSPDGRWLAIAWKEPDQWVFVRVAGGRRIEAVSNVSAQFEGSFPRLRGWCCA